jgi:hypothetical protein
MLKRDPVLAEDPPVSRHDLASPHPADLLFSIAGQQPDGTYTVSLTEDGVRAFATVLGIARDLGGRSTIAPSSTIADILERTAIREELSEGVRQPSTSRAHALRLAVLRRRLRGSEQPSRREQVLGHAARSIIVGLVLLWTVLQFLTSVLDVGAIPGILAGIPADLLQLHPLSAVSDSGAKIGDAGLHLLYGVAGLAVTCIVAVLVRPFARVYRRDQIIVGERPMLRWAAALLRRAEMRTRSD